MKVRATVVPSVTWKCPWIQAVLWTMAFIA